MYKIYINDRPLILSTGPLKQETTSVTHLLTARYTGKVKTLLHYADLLEKGSPKVSGVVLYYADLDQLWQDFKTHYKIVAAAGGLVTLAGTEQLLFIFRRGYLDLPKGKVDKGETVEDAALREVREETGLKKVELIQKGGEPSNYQLTYHTYRSQKKEKRILKPTYWFEMQTEQENLTPELEEGIEWARFMDAREALNGHLPIYTSLQDLLSS